MRKMKGGCSLWALVALILFVALVVHVEKWSRTPEGIAAHEASLEQEAQQAEARTKQVEADAARARAEAADAGIARAYAILIDNGTMADWRAADHLNKAEVVYRLTEQMIMRGNVPRSRASLPDLYACIDQSYAPAIASTPVREVASACAVTIGWLH
jgi:hypothetical protein